MKVDVFGMFLSLALICAASNLVLLSAALPADVVKAEETKSSTLLNATAEAVPNSTASENASVEASDTLPPRIFPDDDKLSTNNDTALKILQSKSVQASDPAAAETSTSIETVIATTTLPASTESATAAATKSSEVTTEGTTTTNSTTEETEEDYDNVNGDETDKSENIQDNGDQPQEGLEEGFAMNGSDKATIKLFADPVANDPVLHSGHFAVIFASTLIILSVLAYVGLILWRGRLEQRYGMRQRLVTEDDYYNNNDVRYFGL